MEMTPEDKKRLRGFMFLSEKPMLYVLNIGESTTLGKDQEEAVAKYGIGEVTSRPEYRGVWQSAPRSRPNWPR